MDAIWDAIDATAMPEAARLMLFEQAALALRGHMADLLRSTGPDLRPSTFTAETTGGVAQLMDRVDDLLAAEARDHAGAIATALVASGAPDALAARVANLFAVDGAIGLARLAGETGVAAVDLANMFIDLGERLGLDWAQARAAVMNPSDPWERLLVAGLARDFQQMRFDFLRGLFSQKGTGAQPQAMIADWATARAAAIPQFRTMIARAQGVGPKLAARIVNELKDKAGGMPGGGAAGVAVAAVSQAGSASADAVSALQNLGFKPAVASTAVAKAVEELGEDAGLNDLVRVALKRAAG